MIPSSNLLSLTERRKIARLAFAAARAGGIAAKHWRAWRQARPVCVLLMAFDPDGGTERIKNNCRWRSRMQQEPSKSVNRGRPPKPRYNIAGIPEEAISAAVEQAVAKRTAEIEKQAEKKVREASKRVQETSPARRVWYGPDKLRAAFFAGQGRTPDQIAQAIGGTTGPRVRTLLYQHGIGFNRDGGFADQIMLNWKNTDREVIEKHAAKRERDPAELAALIVRKVMQGGDKAIDALVSEFDVIG